MRIAFTLIFGSILLGAASGCATQQDRVPAVAARYYYESAPAAALVFDPPMTAYAPLPVFSREGRSPAAFYGYELPTVDVYQLYQRDTQRGDGFPDRFDRTTYSGRSTTTYR